jgi:hypothetical protein
MSFNEQILLSLIFFVYGLSFNILYEIYNFNISLRYNKKFIIYIFDFIFLIFQIFILNVLLNNNSEGKFHIYLFIFIGLGYYISNKFLKNNNIKNATVIYFISNYLIKIIIKFIKYITFPPIFSCFYKKIKIVLIKIIFLFKKNKNVV